MARRGNEIARQPDARSIRSGQSSLPVLQHLFHGSLKIQEVNILDTYVQILVFTGIAIETVWSLQLHYVE